MWVTPKKRRKILYGKLRSEIGTILRRMCEYKGVELKEGKHTNENCPSANGTNRVIVVAIIIDVALCVYNSWTFSL